MGTETAPQTEIESPYPFDAVVLLCGGVRKSPTGEWGLNFESKLKVAAAAEVFKQQLAPVIISSGGALWGAPPIGQLMAESLTRRFGVPQEAIIEEGQSTDTSIQVEQVLKIIEEKGYKHVAILADSEHVKRAKRLFRNYGFEVSPLSAEDYLLQRSPHYQKIIEKLHSSRYWKYWKVRESFLRAMLVVDRKQTLFRKAAKIMRTGAKPRLPGTD